MVWEYKIVHLVADSDDEDQYEERLHGSVHHLNELGREGWELVGFLPHRSASDSRRYHVVMKRPAG